MYRPKICRHHSKYNIPVRLVIFASSVHEPGQEVKLEFEISQKVQGDWNSIENTYTYRFLVPLTKVLLLFPPLVDQWLKKHRDLFDSFRDRRNEPVDKAAKKKEVSPKFLLLEVGTYYYE